MSSGTVLPATDNQPAGPSMNDLMPATGPGAHPGGLRVLLVEDDDGIAAPLTEGLVRAGFDVSRVTTGADALAAPSPDVILLDLGLPDTDGYVVCRQYGPSPRCRS